MQQTLLPLRALSEEEPLERLWRRGSGSLSDAELLSVLLRSGSSARALEWAQEVLAGTGLAGLMHWEPEGLRQRGFGGVRGGAVLALIELTRRTARVRMPQRQLMERRDRVLLAERRRILPETQKSNPGKPAGQEGGRRRC